MMIASTSDAEQEPFPQSGLDALLSAAALDCPDAILVRDDDGPSTAAQLSRRTRLMASQLRLLGLVPGERVLIVAGAQTAAFVALAAALHAGLEPALVPCGLGAAEIAFHAQAAGAVALIGPSRYGTLDLGETYLSSAALVDAVRMIATQGPEPVDGAADISFPTLDALSDPGLGRDADRHDATVILTFQGPAAAPTPVAHRQAALFADALSLVEQARINPSKRIVSTLPLSTLAGLVTGPFAALIGASSLALHGPFDARGLLAACDAEPGFHLVVPGAIGPLFENERLSSDLTSLILVSRFADAAAFVLPAPVTIDRPVIDLYAFGEDTLLAQRRTEGHAYPPARVTDTSVEGLGAKLNRARADRRFGGTDGM